MTAASVIRVSSIDDLHKVLTGTHQVVAMVYVTWCPFCRRAVPLFENAARASSGVFLLALDHEEQFAQKFDVEIYPTLLKFEGAQVTERLAAVAGVGLTEKQILDFLQAG